MKVGELEERLGQIAAAAATLRLARALNLAYGLSQTEMGMYPGQHPALKGAENDYWRACHALVSEGRGQASTVAASARDR
jgi:hypothetical protein